MKQNFTPLDVAAFQKRALAKTQSKESFDFNAIFLFLIVVTLLVLSILLFILIQKKMHELAFVGFFA